MKVIYDVSADVLRIVFRDAPVEDFSEDLPGVTIDYGTDDNMIGIEIQDASRFIENPRSLEHIILEHDVLESETIRQTNSPTGMRS